MLQLQVTTSSSNSYDAMASENHQLPHSYPFNFKEMKFSRQLQNSYDASRRIPPNIGASEDKCGVCANLSVLISGDPNGNQWPGKYLLASWNIFLANTLSLCWFKTTVLVKSSYREGCHLEKPLREECQTRLSCFKGTLEGTPQCS